MAIEGLRRSIRELNVLAEIYSELSEKGIESPAHAQIVQDEMRIIKERMLSLFIESRKFLKKEEQIIEDEERTALAE